MGDALRDREAQSVLWVVALQGRDEGHGRKPKPGLDLCSVARTAQPRMEKMKDGHFSILPLVPPISSL